MELAWTYLQKLCIVGKKLRKQVKPEVSQWMLTRVEFEEGLHSPRLVCGTLIPENCRNSTFKSVHAGAFCQAVHNPSRSLQYVHITSAVLFGGIESNRHNISQPANESDILTETWTHPLRSTVYIALSTLQRPTTSLVD